MDHPCGRCRSPPYLVLLRAGFCLPPLSPEARCALTAPFHPYPPSPSALRPRASAWHARGEPAPTPGAASSHAEPAAPELPARSAESEGGRYIFCATGPSGCPARELPGALSCWSSDFPLPALVPSATPFLRTGPPKACRRQRSSSPLRQKQCIRRGNRCWRQARGAGIGRVRGVDTRPRARIRRFRLVRGESCPSAGPLLRVDSGWIGRLRDARLYPLPSFSSLI
jgi:hypothetical protein